MNRNPRRNGGPLSSTFAVGVAVLVALFLASPANADEGPEGLTVAEVEDAIEAVGVDDAARALPVSRRGVVDSGEVEFSIDGQEGSPKIRQDRQIWTTTPVEHVAQATTTGVQVLSVYTSSEQKSVGYTFDDSDLELNSDGSVTIWPKNQVRTAEPKGLIEKPWAKDGAGTAVKTYFTVEGSRLTQAIPKRSTQWPVVADPKVQSKWWGRSILYTKKETKAIAASGGGCALAALFVPDPSVSKAVAAGCGAIALYANTANSYGRCVALKDSKVGPTIPWIWKC